MKQTCILVLGMHRSGTSALTGVLGLLDVYLADTIKGDENNKKGYFENWKVQQLNDRIFSSIKSNWQDEFFNISKIENINFDFKEFIEIIKNDFEYSEIFAIKDPRVCFLFPLWEKALKKSNVNIKIIIPYRNPIEVANSLSKRDSMPVEKGMLLWAYYFLLAEKFSREYDRVFVNFDDLISDTSKVIEDLSAKLHIDFSDKFNKNKKDIEEFLEPSLKHHNISIDNLSDNTPKIVKDILTLKDKFNDTNLSKEFDTLRYELFSYQKLFYNTSIVSSLDEGQRVKQNLQTKEQELNQTKQNLQTKEQELNQTKQNLQTKEQELNQTKQNLQTKEQELNQTKQNLQTKEQELNQTKQNLQTKEQELNQTKQNLQTKEQELNQTKQNLQTKEQELNQTKQNLQTKEQELNQTKQNLQTKEQELNQTKQELENIKIELANIYISKSWKLTRPLRRFMRIIKK